MGSRKVGPSWSLSATLWVSVCLLSELLCLVLAIIVQPSPWGLTLSAQQVYKGRDPPSKQYTAVTTVQASIPSWIFKGFLAPSWTSVLRRKKLLVPSPKVQTVTFSLSYITMPTDWKLASPSSISQPTVLLNRRRGTMGTTIRRSFWLAFKDKVSCSQVDLELLICLPPPLECWEFFIRWRISQVWWHMPQIPSTRRLRLEGSGSVSLDYTEKQTKFTLLGER